MNDRIPNYPGRVLITPENGDPAFYATLAMADEPYDAGTPINKATLLKDQTAALFGLATDAVPDDALAFLGQFNLHTWMRFRTTGAYEINDNQNIGSSYLFLVVDKANAANTSTLTYYDSITINASTGAITGVDSHTVTASYNTAKTALKAMYGKYFLATSSYGAGAGWYYIGQNSTIWTQRIDGLYNAGFTGTYVKKVQSVYMSTGSYDFVTSLNRNQYPDFDTSGVYTYRYIGCPLDYPLKTKVGIYTGGGSAQTITFDSNPAIVWIQSDGGYWMAAIQGASNGFGRISNSTYSAPVSWGANTLTIASGLVETGTIYRWAALFL